MNFGTASPFIWQRFRCAWHDPLNHKKNILKSRFSSRRFSTNYSIFLLRIARTSSASARQQPLFGAGWRRQKRLNKSRIAFYDFTNTFFKNGTVSALSKRTAITGSDDRRGFGLIISATVAQLVSLHSNQKKGSARLTDAHWQQRTRYRAANYGRLNF